MTLAREWIIFALCLGAGGHLALGFVLHAPELWPWSRAGFYGLMSGLVIYTAVQLFRLLWRYYRRTKALPSSEYEG
jgi:hypothetical protein